jgi:hypothetical protein
MTLMKTAASCLRRCTALRISIPASPHPVKAAEVHPLLAGATRPHLPERTGQVMEATTAQAMQ